MDLEDGKIIVKTGRRLAIYKSKFLDDWYCSYSPRNDNNNSEGTWAEWVALAKIIIEEDKKRSSKRTEGKQMINIKCKPCKCCGVCPLACKNCYQKD